MYNFRNDYSEGGHPNILGKLIETNYTQYMGYGEDEYSIHAKEVIKPTIKNLDASIYFVTGRTHTNLLVISTLLQNHEAVIFKDNLFSDLVSLANKMVTGLFNYTIGKRLI